MPKSPENPVTKLDVIFLYDFKCLNKDRVSKLEEEGGFLDWVTRGDAEYTLINLCDLYEEAKFHELNDLKEEISDIKEEFGEEIFVALLG